MFYDASRKLILKGVDGVVFVADSQEERFEANLESLDNLKANLREQGYEIDKIPWVLQYNKRDLPNAVAVEDLRAEGKYRVLTPDQCVAYAQQPAASVVHFPLCGGISPDLAWQSLELYAAKVLPRLEARA